MSNDYRRIHSDWLVNCTAYKAELLTMSDDEIADAFGSDLKFGTAGLRGVMGAGTNRMNEFVVRRATQGLAAHLNANYENPTVAIAYDSRNNSREFAVETARVLAGNGIKTYIYEELMPVQSEDLSVQVVWLLPPAIIQENTTVTRYTDLMVLRFWNQKRPAFWNRSAGWTCSEE